MSWGDATRIGGETSNAQAFNDRLTTARSGWVSATVRSLHFAPGALTGFLAELPADCGCSIIAGRTFFTPEAAIGLDAERAPALPALLSAVGSSLSARRVLKVAIVQIFQLASIISALLATASPSVSARPAAHYDLQKVAGWQVHVNRELLGAHAELGSRALALMETKLTALRTLLPPSALAQLEAVPIWLGLDDHDKPNAVYHPSAEWLRTHGWMPEKAGAVEVPNAAVFIAWSEQQPMILLHELAHAYHHQVLGHAHAELRAAFARARKDGRYDAVRHVSGKTERAYALNNQEEFFAEMSEAFFGRNDFFPFTADELRRHDPETFALLEKLWRP